MGIVLGVRLGLAGARDWRALVIGGRVGAEVRLPSVPAFLCRGAVSVEDFAP